MDVIGEYTVNGINILMLIFGIVEFSKKLKLSGTWLTVFSMVLGVAFGVVQELSAIYPDVNKWFGIAVVGLAYGVAACGIYDFAKKFIKSE